jgi:hypothetical protein
VKCNELDVTIKQISGGRLNRTYTIDDSEVKNMVAYDIAGNAAMCSSQDILEKKLRPAPYPMGNQTVSLFVGWGGM